LGFVLRRVPDKIVSRHPFCFAGEVVAQLVNVNPTSEHELYLKLFITNGGGW